MSCEGHIDRALAYPWIDFETEDKEIDALRSKGRKIYERIQEIEQGIQKKYPDLSLGEALGEEDSPERIQLFGEYHPINNQIEKLAKTKLVPLRNLIIEYYKGRSIDPDRMIVIKDINPTFLRMHSLGGSWQITRSDIDKLQKMKEYQEEMNLFADFLIHYYFTK